jgi:hypothetical protein
MGKSDESQVSKRKIHGKWFRMERKSVQGASIVWKALVRAFPIIGKWAAWKVGRGNKVRI